MPGGVADTTVSMRLAAFTIHDAFATAALGKPCHLLTSGTASRGVQGAAQARGGRENGDGDGSGAFHGGVPQGLGRRWCARLNACVNPMILPRANYSSVVAHFE